MSDLRGSHQAGSDWFCSRTVRPFCYLRNRLGPAISPYQARLCIYEYWKLVVAVVVAAAAVVFRRAMEGDGAVMVGLWARH